MRTPSEYSLFGDCFRFVADYAMTEEYKDYTIEILVTPKLGSLIHAYFVGKDGVFMDSRCVPFQTRSELLNVFEVGEKRISMSEYVQFSDVESFKAYLYNFFKDGVTRYNEETDTFINVPFSF